LSWRSRSLSRGCCRNCLPNVDGSLHFAVCGKLFSRAIVRKVVAIVIRQRLIADDWWSGGARNGGYRRSILNQVIEQLSVSLILLVKLSMADEKKGLH
jgi:hypothetical protein